MISECDKHYPSRSGQTSLATAVPNITKPVTKNNFGPSTLRSGGYCSSTVLVTSNVSYLASNMNKTGDNGS